MIRNCCLMLTLNGFLFGNQEMQDNSQKALRIIWKKLSRS